MKRTGNITWGGALLLLGILWLLRNLDVIDIRWADALGYWHVSLILAGVCLLISGLSPNRIISGLAGIFLALAIIGGVSKGIYREIHPFFGEDESWFRGKTEGEKPEPLRKKERRLQEENFGYELDSLVREATFNFSSGAGEFTLEGGTKKLFEAKSESALLEYVSNLRRNTSDRTATIDFNTKDGELNLRGKPGKHKVGIKLNENPVWDVSLKVGAGTGNLDLSRLLTRRIRLSTGAAEIKMKLGARAGLSEVNIEAGVASVKLRVPKEADVEIRTSGILNHKDFKSFEKIEKDLYQSPGFGSAGKKIVIHYEAGLSSFEVDRY